MNRYCVKYSETDSKFLQRYQNQIIADKLRYVKKDAPNIENITDDLVSGIMIEKLKKFYR